MRARKHQFRIWALVRAFNGHSPPGSHPKAAHGRQARKSQAASVSSATTLTRGWPRERSVLPALQEDPGVTWPLRMLSLLYGDRSIKGAVSPRVWGEVWQREPASRAPQQKWEVEFWPRCQRWAVHRRDVVRSGWEGWWCWVVIFFTERGLMPGPCHQIAPSSLPSYPGEAPVLEGCVWGVSGVRANHLPPSAPAAHPSCKHSRVAGGRDSGAVPPSLESLHYPWPALRPWTSYFPALCLIPPLVDVRVSLREVVLTVPDTQSTVNISICEIKMGARPPAYGM